MLKVAVPVSDITYRDTASYINILYRDNGRKWICRLVLNDNKKVLLIPDENKNEIRYNLNDIYELEQYKSQLLNVLERYK